MVTFFFTKESGTPDIIALLTIKLNCETLQTDGVE